MTSEFPRNNNTEKVKSAQTERSIHHDSKELTQKQMEVFFRGKNIVITGGASGIGRALVERFSQLGARVSIVDIKTPSNAAEDVSLILADVADKDALENCSSLDNIHYLIIAAGVTSETNEPTEEERKLMDAVNVQGVKNTLSFFNPLLAHDAHIVYIGSDAPPKAYYAQTKKQGAQIVREFSAQHPNFVIEVVYLGPVRTPLFEEGKSPETVQRIKEKIGLYEPLECADELISDIIQESQNIGLQERVMYKKLK